MATGDLRDIGYPEEGIISIDTGGGDGYDAPQELYSPHTCEYCRKFNGGDWTCYKDGEDKDPDNDTCDDIDYIEERLDVEFGFRSPVRCEYSSKEAYEKACKAIEILNAGINKEREERWDEIKCLHADY